MNILTMLIGNSGSTKHTQDIVLKNGLTFTEDGGGIALKNDAGEKIAVLDHDGNFHIRDRVISDL